MTPQQGQNMKKTLAELEFFCSHLHSSQHCPDHGGNTCCGLSVALGVSLQHQLICPANQLSHRLVEMSETGGNSLTAERTDRDGLAPRSPRLRSDLNRFYLPVFQVWFQLGQSLDSLQYAAGCSAQQTPCCRWVQSQFVSSQSVHQSFEVLQRPDNSLFLVF